jgi:hypothetical protein
MMMPDFEIKLPTPEEMKVIAEKWWEPLESVSPHSYCDLLRQLCVRTTLAPLMPELMQELIKGMNGELDMDLCARMCQELYGDFAKAFDSNEGFVKLSSRSPKDAFYKGNNFGKCSRWEHVIDLLVCSMRTADDICLLSHIPEKAYLVFRPWVDILKHQEFRVSVHEDRVIACSQYYYADKLPRLTKAYAERVMPMMARYVRDNIAPLMPTGTFVADVYSGDGGLSPQLIETNPLYRSDTCAFTVAEIKRQIARKNPMCECKYMDTATGKMTKFVC